MTEVARPELANTRRVVIKLGTRVLTHDDGRLALSRLFAVVETAAALRHEGREVLLVSSGAVGLGRDSLGLKETPLDLSRRQACAAVGQSKLMGLYEQGFGRLGVVCAQVLLTQADFVDRSRYLNLRGAMQQLLDLKTVPIINENDVVSTEELAVVKDGPRPVFGDNDRLSALVATKLGADLLVLLTDVEGVYERDPRKHPDAKLVSRMDDATLTGITAGGSASGAGRGGMRSKVDSALLAARAACHAVIASGRTPRVTEAVVRGEDVGTWFPAREAASAKDRLNARDRWIAFAAGVHAVLHLDAGAVAALRDRGASLLAPGVVRLDGDFKDGDVVELRGPDGAIVARGIAQCGSDEARRWVGGGSSEGRMPRALVHRKTMVLEPWEGHP